MEIQSFLSDKNFQQFADAVPAMVLSCDPNGFARYFNQRWFHLTGQTPQQANGLGWTKLLHPDDRQQLFNDSNRLIQLQTGMLEFELRYRMADGNYRWHLLKLIPVQLEADQESRYVGISMDIDREHRLEDQQAAENQAILETAVDGIITINHRGIVLSYNPAAEKMFGYEGSEVLGRNVNLLMPEPDRSQHDGYLANYLATGENQIIGIGREVRGRRKDGSTFPMELAVSEYSLGSRRFFTGIVRDVTERKRLEMELRGHSHVLERLSKGDSLDDVLRLIVEFAESSRPGISASILLLDERNACLQHGAATRLPDFFTEAIDGINIGPAAGSCGTAAFLRERVIVDDIQTHPYWTEFRELAERASLRCCWSEPILSSQEKVLGTLDLYYSQSRKFNEDDLDFVVDIANLAAIAIERLHTETGLRQLAAIVESADEAIVGKSTDWIIESWNRGAEMIYGYRADEAIGQSIELIVPENRRDELRLIQADLESGKRVESIETIRRNKQGQLIDISLAISAIRDAQGALVGLSSIGHDITQRKHAEALAREADRKLLTMVANLPGAAYRCANDPNWTMEFISEGCVELCGFTADELLAQEPTFSSLIHPEDRDAIWNQVQQALRDRVRYQLVYRIIDRSQSTRWILEQGQGVFDASGELLALEGLLTDMTELQEAREQLIQSERLAEIGKLMSAIAHESRNALQRIQSGVDMLLLDLKENDESRRDLEQIDRARRDLQTLLEELRSYAAPIKLTTSNSDLSAIWRRAWEHLQLARGDRSAKVIEKCADIDCKCMVDSFRMEQVFRNLFENALAACADPVEITISCAETSLGNRPALRITVSDNGPGLTAEQLRKMFEAFYTTKQNGTGLGMPIARRIVEAHHGSLHAGNTENNHEGNPSAKFTLLIPRGLT